MPKNINLPNKAAVFGSLKRPKPLKPHKKVMSGEKGWDGRGKPDNGSNQDGQ